MIVVILTILLMIVSFALVGLILIQQGKGGGLVGLGGGGVEQAFGTHVATMAQKATATMAVIFLVLVVFLGLQRSKAAQSFHSVPAEEGAGVDTGRTGAGADDAGPGPENGT